MRSTLHCLVLVVLLVLFGSTQSVGQYVQSAGQWVLTTPTFTDVAFPTKDAVWMLSDAGAIYKSYDGGLSWEASELGGEVRCTSMSIAATGLGVITCGRGRVRTTTDLGQHWQEKGVGVSALYSSVVFTSDTILVCGGRGSLFRTTNRGISWDSLAVLAGQDLSKVAFLKIRRNSAGVLYMVADSNIILRSADNGEHWKALASPAAGVIASMDVSGSSGLCVAYNSPSMVAVTENDGAMWRMTEFPDTGSSGISSVKYISHSTIVTFPRSGIDREYSSDDGNTWQMLPIADLLPNEALHGSTPIRAIGVDERGNGFACGDYGTIIHLNTEGTVAAIASHYYPSVSGWPALESLPSDPSVIHVLGNQGGLATSLDGGLSWRSVYDANYGFTTYIGLHFISKDTGCLFASPYGPNPFPSLKTSDNGSTWQPLDNYPRIESRSYNVGRDGNLYVTSDSIIYQSTDNGIDWKQYSAYTETKPRFTESKVVRSFIEESGIYGMGDTSLILVQSQDSLFNSSKLEDAGIPSYNLLATTDNGESWLERYEFPARYYLKAMSFIGSTEGFAVGDSNLLFHTTDQGRNWSLVPLPEANKNIRLAMIKFNRSGSVGVIVGDQSTIYLTTDRGATWAKDSVSYFTGKQNVHFNNAIFAGDSVVIASSNVGLWRKQLWLPKNVVHGGGDAQPYPYITLSPQLYADQFSCTLYGLYALDDKQLRCYLYDVLGRKVLDLSTLASAQNNGSTATFGFSTRALPNGVYFISLQATEGSVARGFVIRR